MTRSPPKTPLIAPDWNDLKLFLAVARKGSFSRASRELGVEQSTVSRRMASLEEQLHAAVFERTRAGSTLTELGEKLKMHAEAMESRMHAMLDDVGGHERKVEGTVRIALTESVAVHAVIPRVLRQLFDTHPKLDLMLLTSYEAAELGHRRAEVALRFFRPTHGDLLAKRIAVMKTGLIAHRRYRRVPLARLPYVTVELDHMLTQESEYLKSHLRRPPRLCTSSYVGQIEAVRAGLGMALLTRSIQALDPALIELDRGLPTPAPLELWLVAPRSLRGVPRIDAVWQALEEGLAFLHDG